MLGVLPDRVATGPERSSDPLGMAGVASESSKTSGLHVCGVGGERNPGWLPDRLQLCTPQPQVCAPQHGLGIRKAASDPRLPGQGVHRGSDYGAI